MQYVSTRGQAPTLNFTDAMMTGLARDGGLYVPASVPQMTDDQIAGLAGQPYEEIAFRVMWPYLGGAFAEDEFRRLIAAAYRGFGHPARAPLRQLGPNHFLLELFHGPTLAFKDFAMQIIGQMMQAALAKSGNRITIVGATSGDTGAAAVEAFRGLANVDLFILFPRGRVSEVQQRQMTTPVGANVHALALDGDFDDCQARVKDMFNDMAFRDGVRLAGVNSINWARVLAQVVYYFSAAISLGAPARKVSFAVPTGNFGDIFAGYIARQMGLPIHRLVIATNQNDILHRCMESSDYRRKGVVPSISPSMDIEVSSNFERALYFAHDRDAAAVRGLMADLATDGGFTLSHNAMTALMQIYDSGSVDEARTSQTITTTLAETGDLLCPHSAVGVRVGASHARRNPGVPVVTLATAHPAKFPDAVYAATGLRPPLPPRMADLYDRPERLTPVPNDLPTLMSLVRERIAH
ncbi:MAG: threonine synthase [Gemmobacter sp.]